MEFIGGSKLSKRFIVCLGLILTFFTFNAVTVLRNYLTIKTKLPLVRSKEHEAGVNLDSRGIIEQESLSVVQHTNPKNRKSHDHETVPVLSQFKSSFKRTMFVNTTVELDPVKVAFYEGFRGNSWIFDRYFKPFYSEVECSCSGDPKDIVIKQMVSERHQTRAFDIVVFPYDVTVLRGYKLFWEKLHDFRKDNRRDQRWVYATRECPVKLKRTTIPTKFIKNTFHWWLTYRSISDFPSPYGYYEVYETPRNRTTGINWAANKTGLVAWMSSNNQTTWHRQKFVQNLRSLLKVDIYGINGMPCGRDAPECEEKIKGYKFYLALENSCCREYITEKFWRTLTWDCVPIVVGTSKEDYLKIAPPNSFIHADDFNSMKDFAEFVRNVDENDTLYNTFFEWKYFGDAVNSYPDANKYGANYGKGPPKQLYYSCNKVCQMARKYRREVKNQHGQGRTRFFNPKSGVWDGSCGSCGSHDWIKAYEKEPIK